MFGIGMWEMMLILAVALIVVGPKKLPDLAKSIGRAFGEFKRATAELKESIHLEDEFQDLSKPLDDINSDLKAAADLGSTFSDPNKKEFASQPAENTEKNHVEQEDHNTVDVTPAGDNDLQTDTPPGTFKDEKR